MIPILMYHEVVGDRHLEESPWCDPVYTCSRCEFERHMGYLYEQGFRSLHLGDVLAMTPEARAAEKRAVVITFDDGLRSQWIEAVPILQKFGFAAEFFLTVEWVGQPGYLSWEEIKTLAQMGMGIGSHSCHHRFLDDLPEGAARRELIESKQVLERELGQAIRFFAPPGGRLHPTTAQTARQVGYAGICTSIPGVVPEFFDPYCLPRVPIKRSTTIRTFCRIVQCDPRMLRLLNFQTRILMVAKRVMGNDWYSQARNAWLGLRG